MVVKDYHKSSEPGVVELVVPLVLLLMVAQTRLVPQSVVAVPQLALISVENVQTPQSEEGELAGPAVRDK
jgi:hypothetical protein